MTQTQVIAMRKRQLPPPTVIDPILAWIRAGLEAGKTRGLSQSGLGRALGLSPQQGNKLILGQRRVLATELSAISAYLEMPIPNLGVPGTIAAVPLMGEANTNHWHEDHGTVTVNGVNHALIPAITDRYPGLPQFAYKITGTLINRKIADGAYAICVPYDRARAEPHDGDFTLFELRRANLHKTMVLRLRRVGTAWELQPYSSTERDIKRQTVKLTADLKHVAGAANDMVFIKGLVIGTYGAI